MSAKSYSACRGAVAGARGVVRRRSGLLLPRLVALGLLRLLPLAGRRRAPAAARGLREGRGMVRKSEKMMKKLAQPPMAGGRRGIRRWAFSVPYHLRQTGRG